MKEPHWLLSVPLATASHTKLPCNCVVEGTNKNFNLSTSKLNVYCLWYEVVIRTIKAYLYGSKDMVSVLDKEGLGYGYVLGSTWDVFILDSVNFADYGGQMSQHLNCECWSLITVDTYHGWMLADLHSGISQRWCKWLPPTNVLKLLKKKELISTSTGYFLTIKWKTVKAKSVLYQKTSFAPWQRRFGLWICFRRHRNHWS